MASVTDGTGDLIGPLELGHCDIYNDQPIRTSDTDGTGDLIGPLELGHCDIYNDKLIRTRLSDTDGTGDMICPLELGQWSLSTDDNYNCTTLFLLFLTSCATKC